MSGGTRPHVTLAIPATLRVVDGAAVVQFPRVEKPGTYTLLAKYQGSEPVEKSKGKDTFTIR